MATAEREAIVSGGHLDARQTRAHILKHARRQFCKHGYDNFNVTRLAFVCGCSANTVYRQIGDRADLYAETITTLVNDIALDFTIDLNPEMDLADAVHFYFILLMDLHCDQRMRDLRKIMVTDGRSQALPQHRFDRLIRRPIADAFEKYLLQKFAGQFSSAEAPAMATKFLWDTVAGLVDNEAVTGDDWPSDRQIEAAVRMVRAALFTSNQP